MAAGRANKIEFPRLRNMALFSQLMPANTQLWYAII